MQQQPQSFVPQAMAPKCECGQFLTNVTKKDGRGYYFKCESCRVYYRPVLSTGLPDYSAKHPLGNQYQTQQFPMNNSSQIQAPINNAPQTAIPPGSIDVISSETVKRLSAVADQFQAMIKTMAIMIDNMQNASSSASEPVNLEESSQQPPLKRLRP